MLDDPHLGVWCPGCSADVSGPCHHHNCAIGPFGLQAQIDAQVVGRKWFEGEILKAHVEVGNPTRNLPFGPDVDTLILCRDEKQRRSAVLGLGIPARYEIWTSALVGNRFAKIIWLVGEAASPVEAATMEVMMREYLPTKLKPGGEIFIL